MSTDDWETRVDAVWASSDDLTDDALIAAIDALADERPVDDAVAMFHSAGARDSAGLEAEAAPLYRMALELGLDEPLRGEAVIQLASTLRNLDQVDEAVGLLHREFGGQDDHPLTDSANAFLALCLSSKGDDRAGLALALVTLAPHLPRYAPSVRAYAEELLNDPVSD